MAYLTETGLAVPAVSEEQMREVDRIAVEETGPNLFQMMENAGRSLASRARSSSVGRRGPVVVLAGTGGNGGGGICAARHLANHGREVLLAITDAGRLSSVPKEQVEVFRETPGDEVPVSDLGSLSPSVVVDALIGYSLRGAPSGPAAEMIEWANSQECLVISLDVPSGVDSTDGAAPGVHINPDETLTLALPKTGLSNAEVGELWLADIGIPIGTYRRAGVSVPAGVFDEGPIVRLVPA